MQRRIDGYENRLALDEDISKTVPVIYGTWVSVESIVNRIVSGVSWNDILRCYPEIERDDIRMAVMWVATAQGFPIK